MTYTEFKENFLPEFLKIKSFAGRIKYADQNLQRIGSGSGRIVYDIDGEKALKLAKNPKGIAQNESETDAGYYNENHPFITIVFDSPDDNTWLIAEKAKKVNEARIKQLTGIPNLSELQEFLRNHKELSDGHKKIFTQSSELEEFFWENEFASDLANFVANYNQHPGDFGRPSSYGEVLRNGKPTIVLTDYGINDETYYSHYSGKKPQKYRMYELYNYADGNDDILSELPPQDAVDTRQSMWALMPYGVGDGDGVINERFIKFIENTDKYPTRRILPSTPSLTDGFHDIVNNLNEVLEKVEDKKKFYNNLLELQNYLIRGKFFDREPLGREAMSLNEATPMGMGMDRSYGDKIAKSLAEKLNLGEPQYLGGGGFGLAYQINNNKVLKLTTDLCEVDAGGKTHRAKPKHLIYVDKIYKVIATEQNKTMYALIEDFIPDKPTEMFSRYIALVTSLGNDLYGGLLDLLIKGKSKLPEFAGKTFNDFPEMAKLILSSNPEADINAVEREGAYQFMLELFEVKQDLLNLGIKSYDFVEPKNLGYKNGVLVYFDIGNCRAEEPQFSPEDTVTLPEGKLIEDGSARFSTPDSIGRDNFPVYNQSDDGSPLQDNNLPVNIFAEDLEYNHVVGDATQDRFEISEELLEDVASKYAEKLGISPEFSDFEKKYDTQQFLDKAKQANPKNVENKQKILRDKKGAIIIKNPKTLQNISDDSRGIVDKNGNLYLEQQNLYIHDTLANFLAEKGEIEYQPFWYKDPPTEFITVQRLNGTNMIFMGESNSPLKPLGKRTSNWVGIPTRAEIMPLYQKFLDKAKQMNPQYEFINELVQYSELYEKNIDPEKFFERKPAVVNERQISYMPGATGVEVKKKCRLGGKGNTSVACNQGDIKNLKFKPINENVNVDIPAKLSGFNTVKIVDDGQIVGEIEIMDRGIHGDNHYIAIDKIFIDKQFRGKGYANDAMKLLFRYADKNNLIITLTPDNMWGASVPKLKAWYKSLGFIENKGKKKDFQTMQLMYRIPKRSLTEEIDASEAYRDEGVMNTMINGKKDVGLIGFKYEPELRKLAIENNFGFIPIKQSNHNIDMNIVYRKTPRGETNAKKLEQIMISHGGYVQDQSPEEAYEIGKLLDYSDESIDKYVQRIYGKKVPQAPEYADYVNMDEGALNEYREQMEKVYGKTGIYDQDDMNTILSITGGDPYTKFIADIFYYLANRYNKEMVTPTKLSERDKEILEDTHERIKRYDKNVLPIRDLYAQEHNAHPLEKMNDLRDREVLIERIKTLPTVLLRNLRADIRRERDHYEFQRLFEITNLIKTSMKLIDQTNPEHRDKILKKVFSSANDTFEAVAKRLQDTSIPYLSQDDAAENIVDKVRDLEGEAEILYNQGNILVVKINSAEAMGYIGCSSQWCFASNPQQYWDQYTGANGFATIVFNFNEAPSERNAMVVVLESGEVYDMYNDYMEDGDAYLDSIGVSKYIPRGEYAEVDESVGVKPKTNKMYYRAVADFLGREVEFEPNGYYEAVDKDGNPIMKYDTFWKSDKPETSASKKIGGAVMGIYSMMKHHGSFEKYIYLYAIAEEPDVDISHWSYGDFEFLEEVRYRRPVKGKYIGKIAITDDMKKRFDAYYNLQGLDAYDEPDEESLEIAQNTDYNDYLDKMKSAVHENTMSEAQLMSLQDLPFKQEVEQLGGKIFSVGGAVRDEFLGKESKDLDVLITGIPMDQLEQLLGKYGRVDAVGKSFGVLKFRPKGGDEIDIAIPRTEKPTGDAGHKAFDVTSDHALPIEKDLERRDFTINAIAKDSEGNIVDPYGGQKDLKDKTIRIVNPDAFSDDPLRMLRAVQFASRFGFTIEPITMKMIQDNAQRIKEIPAERVLTEFDKILHKGNIRIGAQLLKDTGLFQQIFGFDLKQSVIDRTPFEDIKTMGEFIYLLTRLLSNPSAYYKTNLKGDIDTFKEIKALEMAFQNPEESNPIKTRAIASNMYLTSPKTLESQIIPEPIKIASQELLSGKYPKSLNDLAVNGNDLMALGLQGKEIGDALKMMLLRVYGDKIRNNREELLSLLPAKNNVNEFEYPRLHPEKEETWNIDGQEVNINFFIDKYYIWNQGEYTSASMESVSRFLEDEYPQFAENEKFKKDLLWLLTRNELLDENTVKRVIYSAVVLDDRSRQRLIERFRDQIPEGWEVIAHHMTINMGELSPEFMKFNGMSIRLSVDDIAIDDKVLAVGVSGFESKNAKPHITIAVNRREGGKPMMSNNLTNWQKLKRPLLVTGKVTEIT